jgi:hypothetical protein
MEFCGSARNAKEQKESSSALPKACVQKHQSLYKQIKRIWYSLSCLVESEPWMIDLSS